LNSLGGDTAKCIEQVGEQWKASAPGEHKLFGFKVEPDALSNSLMNNSGEQCILDSGEQSGQYRRQQYRQMIQNRLANI